MVIKTFQCSNCGNINYKPLLGNTTTCDCGLKHPSYLWSYNEEEESMSSPCNDCSVDCFTDECPIKHTSGEDWRSILDDTPEDIKEQLKKLYPHGHERFIELSLKEMELHSKKNYDYAHGGNPLGNFVRVASILSNYPGLKLTPAVIALIYAFKQLDSTLWQLSQGYEGQVEGMDKRLEDVHVYVKLARILLEEA